MKTRWIEITIIVMALGLLSICFAAWDNTKPADSDSVYSWPTSIRNNWDALEDILGLNLNVGTTNVTNPTYGAIGDGVADDTIAIQAAIAAVEAAGGGIVLLPKGTYLLDGATGLIIDNSNVTLCGVGAGSIIKEGASFTGGYLITIKGSGTYVDYCGIRDLQVLGVSTDTGNGIYIGNSWHANLTNLVVQNLSDGVVINDDGHGAWWNELSNVRCINCRNSTDTGHGLWLKIKAHETSVFGGEMHTCNVAVELGTWNEAVVGNLPANVNFFGVAFEAGTTRPWTYNPTGGAYVGNYGLVIHGIRSTFVGCRFEDDDGDDMFISKLSTGVVFVNLSRTLAHIPVFHADFAGSYTISSDQWLTEHRGTNDEKTGNTYIGSDSWLTVFRTSVRTAGVDDTNARFTQDHDGIMQWGSGAAAVDTKLYRLAADTLKIDDSLIKAIGTLADDATPSVTGRDIWLTGGVTNITDFDDGVTGQIITVIAEHGLTITDGTNIFLDGSANWAMTATDTLTLICKADNKWYEVSRSDNGA